MSNSYCVANASALFGDAIVNMTSHQKGLLYEVKLAYIQQQDGNWRGSLAGEEVQHDSDQQRCSV